MKGTRTGLQSRNITGDFIGPGAILEVTFPNPFDASTYLAWLRVNGLENGPRSDSDDVLRLHPRWGESSPSLRVEAASPAAKLAQGGLQAQNVAPIR